MGRYVTFDRIFNFEISEFVKMKEEKVIVDEEFVMNFEDSTQPTNRIKQELDPDSEKSKVFVDAITQTEASDADLKIEISTQTDQPLDYVCKLCRHKSPLDQSDSIKNPSEKNLNQRQILSSNSHLKKRIHNRKKK